MSAIPAGRTPVLDKNCNPVPLNLNNPLVGRSVSPASDNGGVTIRPIAVAAIIIAVTTVNLLIVAFAVRYIQRQRREIEDLNITTERRLDISKPIEVMKMNGEVTGGGGGGWVVKEQELRHDYGKYDEKDVEKGLGVHEKAGGQGGGKMGSFF